jgi:hypothetical protein
VLTLAEPTIKVVINPLLDGDGEKHGYDVIVQPDFPKQYVARFLAPENRAQFLGRVIRPWKEIIRYFDNNISPQEWVEAIGKGAQAYLSSKQPASYEAPVQTDSYMVMNGQLFKMTPTHILEESQAIELAKQQVILDAKIQAEGIVKETKNDAEGILLAASKKKDELDAFIIRMKNNASLHPPQWAVEKAIPLRFASHSWQLRIIIPVTLKYFDTTYTKYDEKENQVKYYRYSWKATKEVTKNIPMWVPVAVDGDYSLTSIRIEQGSPLLPHIGYDAACFSVSDNPNTIVKFADLYSLRDSISRCMERVDTTSLRIDFSEWKKYWKGVIPPDLLKALEKGTVRELASSIGEGTPITSEKEEETWNAA